MKEKTKSIVLDNEGIDAAAGAIEAWLTEAKVQRSDILRVRLTVEELLGKISRQSAVSPRSEMRFRKRLGAGWLRIRYSGERFDPTQADRNEMEEFSAAILSQTGFLPEWRWRGGQNELRLRIPAGGIRSEFVMLGCIVLAVAVGLLGGALPGAVRTGVIDYALNFLSGGFLNLLNTFIGLMIFLSIVTGICGLGSGTESLRKVVSQAQSVVMKCVTLVCFFLPLFIFSSLVTQFWENDTAIFARLWKPLAASVVLTVASMAVYLALTCRKLRVKPSVMLSKLLPAYLIALSTGSSAAAISTGLEIDEKQLGIDAAFSRMAIPIGGMLFAGIQTLNYMLCTAFLAEHYGVQADLAWWIIYWLVCVLLTMATPPVMGGGIACLSILMLQLSIPQEGLAVGITLSMFLDFICTGARVMILHLEVALQADKLGLMDREVLVRK